jgi:Tfp pilus assembly protein PilN
METSTTALLNLALNTRNGNGQKPTVALVQADREAFETSWVHNGALRYSHMVNFDKEPVADRAAQIRRELRSGFRAAFSFQQWKGPGGIDSAAIYLTGGKDANDLLAETKNGPDFAVSPFPVTRIASHLSLTDSKPSQTVVPVIGLALRGIQKVPYTINLLPLNLRKKTKKIGIYLAIILFFIVVGLSVAWGFSSVVKKRLVLHRIEQEIDALKSEVAEIQAIQADTKAVEEMMTCIVEAGKEDVSHLDILKELSTILPSSVWLTNMRYRKGSLQLSGYAQSASDLIAILDGSPLFHESEFTAPITRGRDGESFKITTQVEKK